MRATFCFLAILFIASPAAGAPTAADRSEVAQSPGWIPSWVDAAPPCMGGAPAAPSPAVPEEASPAQPAAPASGPAPGPVPAATSPPIQVEPAAAPGSQAVRIGLAQTAAEDELRYHYDSFAARVAFSYRPDADLPARRLEATFSSLREFADQDGDGLPDPGEPVLQEHAVAGLLHFARTWEADCGFRLQWTYFLDLGQPALDAVPEDDRAAFLEGQPRLTLRFTHLAQRTFADGVTVVPERAKIDIGVDHYAFRGNGTRLAFRAVLLSEEPLAPQDGLLSASADGATFGFSWAPAAVADGAEAAVPARVEAAAASAPDGRIDAASAFAVTFGYPRATHLLHDPELGMFEFVGAALRAAREFAQAHPVAMAVGAAAGAACLAALGAVRRRWP